MTDIFPALRYNDAHAAIDLLVNAFGFTPRAVHENDNGVVQHAELAYGDGMVMLGETPREPDSNRLDMPVGGASVYIVVEDPDAHFERAKATGVKMRRELRDEDYGSRGYTAEDAEGNLWSFGTYRP
jgi:uncharacterized glyoxalase superfamily protein PhnB